MVKLSQFRKDWLEGSGWSFVCKGLLMKWKENKKTKVWESGKYRIAHGENYVKGGTSVERQPIYHCYHDKKYLHQSGELDEAKKLLERHATKNKPSK